MTTPVQALVYGSNEWKRFTSAHPETTANDDTSFGSLVSAPLSSNSSLASDEASDIGDEFTKYVHMSPIERIIHDYLESRGLTEESLDALPAELKEQIENEIKKLIEKKLHIHFSDSTEAPTLETATGVNDKTTTPVGC